MGHEPMAIVEAVGQEVRDIKPCERVVIPFNIYCRGVLHVQPGPLLSVRDHSGPRPGEGRGAARYTKLYGEVPGGQAELLRVPQAQFGPIKAPEGPPDEGSSISRMSCPPHGKPWSTPQCPMEEASRCSAWGRPGRCAAA